MWQCPVVCRREGGAIACGQRAASCGGERCTIVWHSAVSRCRQGRTIVLSLPAIVWHGAVSRCRQGDCVVWGCVIPGRSRQWCTILWSHTLGCGGQWLAVVRGAVGYGGEWCTVVRSAVGCSGEGFTVVRGAALRSQGCSRIVVVVAFWFTSDRVILVVVAVALHWHGVPTQFHSAAALHRHRVPIVVRVPLRELV